MVQGKTKVKVKAMRMYAILCTFALTMVSLEALSQQDLPQECYGAWDKETRTTWWCDRNGVLTPGTCPDGNGISRRGITLNIEYNSSQPDTSILPNGQRSVIENLFKDYFATGIFNITNGKHFVEKINVYTNRNCSENTDVQWSIKDTTGTNTCPIADDFAAINGRKKNRKIFLPACYMGVPYAAVDSAQVQYADIVLSQKLLQHFMTYFYGLHMETGFLQNVTKNSSPNAIPVATGSYAVPMNTASIMSKNLSGDVSYTPQTNNMSSPQTYGVELRNGNNILFFKYPDPANPNPDVSLIPYNTESNATYNMSSWEIAAKNWAELAGGWNQQLVGTMPESKIEYFDGQKKGLLCWKDPCTAEPQIDSEQSRQDYYYVDFAKHMESRFWDDTRASAAWTTLYSEVSKLSDVIDKDPLTPVNFGAYYYNIPFGISKAGDYLTPSIEIAGDSYLMNPVWHGIAEAEKYITKDYDPLTNTTITIISDGRQTMDQMMLSTYGNTIFKQIEILKNKHVTFKTYYVGYNGYDAKKGNSGYRLMEFIGAKKELVCKGGSWTSGGCVYSDKVICPKCEFIDVDAQRWASASSDEAVLEIMMRIPPRIIKPIYPKFPLRPISGIVGTSRSFMASAKTDQATEAAQPTQTEQIAQNSVLILSEKKASKEFVKLPSFLQYLSSKGPNYEEKWTYALFDVMKNADQVGLIVMPSQGDIADYRYEIFTSTNPPQRIASSKVENGALALTGSYKKMAPGSYRVWVGRKFYNNVNYRNDPTTVKIASFAQKRDISPRVWLEKDSVVLTEHKSTTLKVYAELNAPYPLTGMQVNAYIYGEDGTLLLTRPLVLADSGKSPDIFSDNGEYTGSIPLQLPLAANQNRFQVKVQFNVNSKTKPAPNSSWRHNMTDQQLTASYTPDSYNVWASTKGKIEVTNSSLPYIEKISGRNIWQAGLSYDLEVGVCNFSDQLSSNNFSLGTGVTVTSAEPVASYQLDWSLGLTQKHRSDFSKYCKQFLGDPKACDISCSTYKIKASVDEGATAGNRNVTVQYGSKKITNENYTAVVI